MSATPRQLLTLLLSLSLSLSAWGAAAPQRIASLNLCTDQVLLELVDVSRLVSITFLSQQTAYSPHWQLASQINSNRGLAEEIIPQQPDLILSTQYATLASNRILQQLAFPLVLVEQPQSLDGLEGYVMRIANLTGDSEKAKTRLAQLQQRLAALTLPAQKPTALILGPNGHTAGNNSIKGEILQLAGFDNLASRAGIESFGQLNLEQLLRLDPDYLLLDDASTNRQSRAQSILQHPVLQQHFSGQRIIEVPANQWLCPSLATLQLALTLAEVHQ